MQSCKRRIWVLLLFLLLNLAVTRLFHSKSHAKMNELRTKEPDLELIFFFNVLALTGVWDMEHIPV